MHACFCAGGEDSVVKCPCSFLLTSHTTCCMCRTPACLITWARRSHDGLVWLWVFSGMNTAQVALCVLLLAGSLLYPQCWLCYKPCCSGHVPCAYVYVPLSGSVFSFAPKPLLFPCPEEVRSLGREYRQAPSCSLMRDCRGERERVSQGRRKRLLPWQSQDGTRKSWCLYGLIAPSVMVLDPREYRVHFPSAPVLATFLKNFHHQ